MAAGLNAREAAGRRIRLAAWSLIGAPFAVLLLAPYLTAARRGLTDRWAPRTMAAVAVAMALLPLWILGLLRVLGRGGPA